jgi:uncharacterized protein YdaU (DUF1376 family)
MSKEASPSFQWYAADYLSDLKTMQMTLAEEGSYVRLLSVCWREGSLPADPAALKAICKGAQPSELVLGCFKRTDGGRLIHLRLEHERDKQHAWREQKSRDGQKGAAARWSKPKELNGRAIAGPLEHRMAEPMANDGSSVFSLQSSISVLKEKEKTCPIASPKPDAGLGIRFQKFYQAYPRHEAPKEARKAWDKIKPDQELLDRMLAWIDQAVRSEQWTDKKLIPHPAKWLSQRRWEGDPPPPPKRPATLLDKWEAESSGH